MAAASSWSTAYDALTGVTGGVIMPWADAYEDAGVAGERAVGDDADAETGSIVMTLLARRTRNSADGPVRTSLLWTPAPGTYRSFPR